LKLSEQQLSTITPSKAAIPFPARCGCPAEVRFAPIPVKKSALLRV
jgi:hypothetical protein